MTPELPTLRSAADHATATRSETAIQAEILRYLAACPGVQAWRINSRVVMMPGKGGALRPVRFGIPGGADILGWVRTCGRCKASPPGAHHAHPSGHEWSETPCRHLCRSDDEIARFLAVEVKRPGKKPNATQAAFLELVRSGGGLAVVATCVQDVVDALGRGATAPTVGRRPDAPAPAPPLKAQRATDVPAS